VPLALLPRVKWGIRTPPRSEFRAAAAKADERVGLCVLQSVFVPCLYSVCISIECTFLSSCRPTTTYNHVGPPFDSGLSNDSVIVTVYTTHTNNILCSTVCD
jgi:hypothetical protein